MHIVKKNKKTKRINVISLRDNPQHGRLFTDFSVFRNPKGWKMSSLCLFSLLWFGCVGIIFSS